MRLPYIYISLLLLSSAILMNACQEETYVGPLPEKVDFNFHIRPILSDNCFLCHGPDESSREADLRLDLEETAKAVLDNGRRPIHARKWSESEIMRRVTSDDPDLQMPPPEMKKKLSPKELALFKKWMDQGAAWKEYWAFIPPQLPDDLAFQKLQNTSEKIDFLIDKALKNNDLSPSEKANDNALIRRLSYLLTGLPPSLESIEQFTNDNRPDAYEKLVDQLLASPQFGERWARHWMDLVRYAEFKGHEFDYPVIGAWQYRDYLIKAFNADVPYDQLVKEHLAGDLLETPRINAEDGTNESIHGTQFYTFGEGKHSPVSIKQEEADYIDNMIDVTTKTFQGLTVACARCHDHKFDAIPTTDYYSLYGMFESTRFALIPSNTTVDIFEKVDSIEAIKRKMRELIAGRNVDGVSYNKLNVSPNDPFKGMGIDVCFTKENKAIVSSEYLDLHETFPPLAGGRGWKIPNLVKFHPPTLFALLFCPRQKLAQSGGENPCKSLDLLQKINHLKFAKIELNSPAVSGGESPYKSLDVLQKTTQQAVADEQNYNFPKKVLTNSPIQAPATIIADFRNGTVNNWTANGIAFNKQNTLGEPIFDKKGRLIKLESGKVSSRILGKGLQGALRSPTFIIDKEKIVVRAAGEGAMIRIIVDNFQLIQNPIYGGLETWVEGGSMKDYVLDLKMVQGEKAYLEFLPGKKISKNGKGHYYEFLRDAWLAAEYVVAFDGEKIPTAPPLTTSFEFVNKEQAYQNWIAGTANPKEIDFLNKEIKNGRWKMPTKEVLALSAQASKLAESLYDSTFFQGVTEGDAQFSPVFIRGNRTTLSEEKVPHQFFAALKDFSPDFTAVGSGRKELAAGIANARNPLTARVMVNRIWHHIFGRGIVETVDNFGLQGKPPTHPELLDYLAIQFIEDGWSIKKLIKNIVLTEAFQRSTKATKSAIDNDPQNLFLSHFAVRRLEGEAIRDALLAVSGRLDTTLYGEPFEIYLTDFIKGRGRPPKSGALDGFGRRSIYQTIRRNFLPPFMLTFDMPAPFSTFGKRNVSNVPAQSLTMMNDPLVQQQAAVWATRILERENTFEDRVKAVYLTAFARQPTAEEVKEAQLFFQEQAMFYELEQADSQLDMRIWIDYCHSIFMMKEFVFLI